LVARFGSVCGIAARKKGVQRWRQILQFSNPRKIQWQHDTVIQNFPHRIPREENRDAVTLLVKVSYGRDARTTAINFVARAVISLQFFSAINVRGATAELPNAARFGQAKYAGISASWMPPVGQNVACGMGP